MKNSEVVEAFLRKEMANNSTGSLHSTGTKLFSYATCIAEWEDKEWDNDTLIINLTKYSVTSSKHLYYLIYYLKRCLERGFQGHYNTVLKVLRVPIGESSLRKYQAKLWELE